MTSSFFAHILLLLFAYVIHKILQNSFKKSKIHLRIEKAVIRQRIRCGTRPLMNVISVLAASFFSLRLSASRTWKTFRCVDRYREISCTAELSAAELLRQRVAWCNVVRLSIVEANYNWCTFLPYSSRGAGSFTVTRSFGEYRRNLGIF